MIAFAVPVAAQALAMLVDEGVFHRRRGLPRWERLGHPLDTTTTALCYAWLVFRHPTDSYALAVYVALAAFSCLFITKDEFVHAKVCEPKEQWLHSLLFVLHPIVFLSFGLVWWLGLSPFALRGALAATIAFGAYQLIYWSLLWKPARSTTLSTTRSAPVGITPKTIP
jgi:hypothetical protein